MTWSHPAYRGLREQQQGFTGLLAERTEAVNAATVQMVWQHFIPTTGYRGGVSNSGNIVFLTLASGDLLMLNAQTGATIKDLVGRSLDIDRFLTAA